MPEVGIRALKNETSEIIRAVREEGIEYVVTYRGKPVAVIRPLDEPAQDVDEILAAAAAVYEGLSSAEVAEVEKMARRRADFFGEVIPGAGEPAPP